MTDPIFTINPATGRVLETHTPLSDTEIEDKIEACHAAFEEWRKRPPEERAKVITAIGEELRKNAESFARLMTEEMGKLLTQSQQEIELCAAICDYTARIGPDTLAAEERDIQTGRKGRIVYAPLGVVYGIQPWNFPCYQVVRYSIASLMAGNGVLLKHATSVTGSGLFLEKIYRDAGLPDNLFSVLLISHEQSDKVIEHPKVRGVTFTGSAEAGAHVAAKAGGARKKSVLELGSNDAYLVLSDADIDLAVESCVMGRIYNNGETCVAVKRIIVSDAVYDAFRDAYVARMEALKLGDPCETATDIGPMAREDLRDDLHKQVEDSVAKGARIATGGKKMDGPGWYYPATVLEDVTAGQPAYDDELFGPVASLIRARDDADAMRIANDSRFGLGGGIFCKDEDKALALAEQEFDTGMVNINGFGLALPNMPFGGVKDSGYGREHGGFGIREFTNTKAIFLQH